MLKHRRRMWIAVFAATVGGAAALGAVLATRPSDSLCDILMSGVLEVSTEYAPGYSEEGFSQVRRGMTEDEVVALLGPALDTGETQGPLGGQLFLARYSRPRGDVSFWERNVLYFADKPVAKVWVGLYVD
jgi:hypothetical protein